MVAPHCMISHIFKYIDEQIELAKQGKEAYIGFKCNSVTSKKMIDKLIEASQAGVQIDMVVRGICCIIFGKNNPTVYISSADLMTRNLERRVEVAAPVLDEKLKHKLLTMFDCMLRDNVKACSLENNGKYKRIKNKNREMNSQEYFFKNDVK